jgi:phospholipase C
LLHAEACRDWLVVEGYLMQQLKNAFGFATSLIGGLFQRPSSGEGASSDPRVKHVVVLVMENRSFDHLLGNLMTPDFEIDGLTGVEFNYANPKAKTGEARVTKSAPYVPDVDPSPSHEFHDVMLQLFSQFTVPIFISDSNQGFVYDYAKVSQDETHASKIMQCFGSDQLPALHTLARQFAVCDHWYSSLPGPTWPNRFFIHCATSGGFVDNAVRTYDMNTIFDNLSRHGVSWRVYYHDVPQSLALSKQVQYFWSMYEDIDEFFSNCKYGLLPAYSFIEPRYFNEGADRANDQHPIHGVPLGDALIADIYEAVRRSPNWEETILLITWDEHGGFYDHVLPPTTVNPDGKDALEFNFGRLGVRVPAVVISPYIEKGTIDSACYDHASIPATLKALFGLPDFLTRRDARANTFDRILNRTSPRTDAPMTLPRISPMPEVEEPPESMPPTELHASLVALAESLGGGADYAGSSPPRTEQQAAIRVKAALEQLRASKK